jgi:hypothetical protein
MDRSKPSVGSSRSGDGIQNDNGTREEDLKGGVKQSGIRNIMKDGMPKWQVAEGRMGKGNATEEGKGHQIGNSNRKGNAIVTETAG